MIDLLYKIAAFAVTLGVLVVFHELGHYAVARLLGVKVLRFSVGFGRIVWSRHVGRDRTEWALSAIPLGGYVKMVDEREGTVAQADLPRAFNRQPVATRIAIVAAGPLANLLLAALLFAATFVVGVPGQRPVVAEPAPNTPAAEAGLRRGDLVRAVNGKAVGSWQELRWQLIHAQGADAVTLAVARDGDRGDTVERTLPIATLRGADWEQNPMSALGLKQDLGPPLVDQVLPGKPAERGGLRAGDRILAIDGVDVHTPADVATLTNAKPGEPLRFRYERDGTVLETLLTPEATTDASGRRVGVVGLRLRVDPAVVAALGVTVRYGVLDALAQGTQKTLELSAFTVKMLGRILIGEASVRNISGPITMADFAGQSAQAGLLVFASYLALISISLGVLNLLPVPLLDGGHLLYYLAELIKGSPVSDRAFEVGQRIGMAVLAMLMVLALVNDVSRLF
ncbi:MAG TPA: RIP metalloprotease RseP [Casimicrobiaceae bacterium]|jgi:regulator of sigma E protease